MIHLKNHIKPKADHASDAERNETGIVFFVVGFWFGIFLLAMLSIGK